MNLAHRFITSAAIIPGLCIAPSVQSRTLPKDIEHIPPHDRGTLVVSQNGADFQIQASPPPRALMPRPIALGRGLRIDAAILLGSLVRQAEDRHAQAR